MKQAAKHVKSRDFRVSQKIHNQISTHLLTVLAMRAIVQLEQRKGVQKGTGECEESSSGDLPDAGPVRRKYKTVGLNE